MEDPEIPEALADLAAFARAAEITVSRVRHYYCKDRDTAEGSVQAAGDQHLAVKKGRRSVLDASLIQAAGHGP
jgi:hypothetical protein